MKKRIKIAIVGYGNIGKGVESAVQKNNSLFDDMEIAGIISRRPEKIKFQLKNKCPVLSYNDNSTWKSLDADVAILCGGSKTDLPIQGPQFAKYFSTVDSFDNHNMIHEYKKNMNKTALEAGTTSIISCGWDPGTFSVLRLLLNSFIIGSKSYGFYGLTEKGGLSQGHSDAVRRIHNVQDARQYTHAIPESIKRVRDGENPELDKGEMHWREVYVVLKKDTLNERKRVEKEIKTDKDYFAPYKTTVKFVSQEEIDKNHSTMPHDGVVIASGKTGSGNNSLIEYKNIWQSNPEGTAEILVACARACYRINKTEKNTGAFTMLDIPPKLYSPHDDAYLDKKIM